jgi:hypothetical protein
VPAIHPAITVGRPIIIATSVIVTVVKAVIVSGPVRATPVSGIVSAPVSAPVSGIISVGVEGIVIAIISIIGTIIWISVAEPHSPSGVSPTHADAPAEGASGIPVQVGVIGIVIVPAVIVIGKPSQG